MADDPQPGTLRRLLQLWSLAARMDLIWMLRDLPSFVACVCSELVINLAGVTAVLLLADRFNGIGSWTRQDVLFLLGFAALTRGLLDLLLNFNVLHISRRIGRGQLDHVLVKPDPLWVSFATEGFVPFSGSPSLLPGIVLLGWWLHGTHTVPSLGWSGLFALNLAGAALLSTSISLLSGCLAFWAPRAGEEVSMSTVALFDGLRAFPLDGLGPVLRGILLTVLPVGLTAWYPARALLALAQGTAAGTFEWESLVTPATGLAALGAALLMFRSGLTHYGKTGSQRYSLFGHRR